MVAHPDNLWTNYFTSSDHVDSMRSFHGEPDVIQVRRTFATAEQALVWEQRLIRRLGAVSDPRWINRCVFGDKIFSIDEDTRKRIVETRRTNGKPWHSTETASRISISNKGVPRRRSKEDQERIAQQFKVLNEDPDFQKKRKMGNERRWSDPVEISRQSELLKANTHTDAVRKKIAETRMDPAYKAEASRKSKNAWAAREVGMKAGYEAWWSDPEKRRMHRESCASRMMPVIADGVVYDSIKACARAYGRYDGWVRHRISKGVFRFVDRSRSYEGATGLTHSFASKNVKI